jgi:hypothetical protein
MQTVLEEYTTEEQRSVVLILRAKGLIAKDIHKYMFPLYSGKCLSHKVVQNWVNKFSQGCSNVAGDACPGSPIKIPTEATVRWVEELI